VFGQLEVADPALLGAADEVLVGQFGATGTAVVLTGVPIIAVLGDAGSHPMAAQPVAFGALLLVTAVLLLPIREQQVATGLSTTSAATSLRSSANVMSGSRSAAIPSPISASSHSSEPDRDPRRVIIGTWLYTPAAPDEATTFEIEQANQRWAPPVPT
jgi:hypothetical protein